MPLSLPFAIHGYTKVERNYSYIHIHRTTES